MIRVSELTVYVRDRELGRVGALAGHDLASLVFEPVQSGVGTWSISLPDQVRVGAGWVQHELCAALREPGAGIVVRRGGRTIFSGPMDSPTLVRSRGDLRGTWAFKGYSDEVVLDDALAWPVPSNPVPQAGELAADVRTGTGSAVIVAYVQANIAEGAPASRRGLLASKLVTLQASLVLGSTVKESARYENLLEVCQRVARQSGAHFRVLDEGGQLVLQTYVARDRTDDTRWTVTDGFLDKLEWQSGAPGVTRPLVGGSGVGEYRPMVAPTTPTSIAAEAAWGRKREAFIDSRGTDEVAELTKRGVEALEHPVAGLVVDPSDETAIGWGTLWEVGDLLTLSETGVQYAITGVAVAVQDAALSVQAVLGSISDEEAVQRSVEQRVSNLERNDLPADDLRGPKGDPGPPGPAGKISGATASGLPAGSQPTVAMGGTPENRSFAFGIPSGAAGAPGTPGAPGAAAAITGATAKSLAAGSAASVVVGGTPNQRTFEFGIPRGDQGVRGPEGVPGTPGGPGPQGPGGTIESVSLIPNWGGTAPHVIMGGTPEARTIQFGLHRGPKGDQGDQGIPGDANGIPRAGTQVADWNDAVSNGFYWSSSAANGPKNGWFAGFVATHGTGRLLQEVRELGEFDQAVTWRRYAYFDGSTYLWFAWTSVPMVAGDTTWANLPLNTALVNVSNVTPQWRIHMGALRLRGGVALKSGNFTTAYTQVSASNAIPDLYPLRDGYHSVRLLPSGGGAPPGRMYTNPSGALMIATTGGTAPYYLLNCEQPIDL